MPTATRRRATLPAELRPEDVVVVVDTREQDPFDLSPLRVMGGTLPTGDYGLAAAPDVACVERKTLDDLLACVGRERERFERELQRMLAYPVRALLVESTWSQLEAGGWRGQITPQQAVGSCLGWVGRGVPIIMAGTHARAGKYAARLLYTAARRYWKQLREFARNVMEVSEP